jgi:transposase
MGKAKKPKSKTGGNQKGSKHPDLLARASAIAAYEAGMSPKEIKEKYGISKASLYRFLARNKDEQTIERKEGSGRKRKTTASEDRRIILSVLRNRESTCQEVADSFGERRVSARLISRRIRELTDLKSHWKIKKPFISAKNRQRRVRWCMDRLHYTPDQWKRFLFTDESKFTVRFNQKTRVWRTSEEANETFAMRGTVKHDEHIMVWGGFAAHGVGNLYRINGILEQNQYHDIIRRQLIPSARKLFNLRNWTFQEDNDPKHTANSTKALYNQLHIPREAWPANSPDLNPIENLWQYLDVMCKDRRCNTKEQLFEVLQEAWNRIPRDYLTSLVESMPRRLNAVIDAKGYATKY